MKIVINRCYGGFSLSEEAYKFMGMEYEVDRGHVFPVDYDYYRSTEFRSDPKLINAVETLGEKANGSCADLRVVEIPDGISFEIKDYDGKERVEENHSSWY